MKTKNFLICFFSIPAMAFQPVDINQASIEQISLLPGVGEKLAQSIKLYRATSGLITSEEELLKVGGLTPKKLEKMRQHIIFGKSTKKLKVSKPKTVLKIPKPVIPLSELETKVLKTYGLEIKVDDDLKKRVRLYAWLPEFSVMADMGKNDITSQRKVETKNDSVSRQGGDFGVGIKASFNFEKLIFNSNELDVQKVSLTRMKEREDVLDRLHKSYFRYQRVLLQEDVEGKEQNREIELKELSAQMDAMSSQAFSSFQQALGEDL